MNRIGRIDFLRVAASSNQSFKPTAGSGRFDNHASAAGGGLTQALDHMKHLDSKTVGWIDAFVAVMFAGLFAWAIYAANEAAADAARRYGRNVDSGALVYIGAVIYLAPVACAFALASCSHFLRWRIKRILHWLAVLGAIAPPILSTAYALAH